MSSIARPTIPLTPITATFFMSLLVFLKNIFEIYGANAVKIVF
jgi:hypothetical protein